MKHHTQNDEYVHILKYFSDREGRFLDIGANDGVTLSNTKDLSDLGWVGDYIEPSPRAFKWLRQYVKPESGLYNIAINTFDGTCDFYESGEHLKQGDIGLLSTTKESELARWKSSGEVFQKMKVNCMTFETFYLMVGEPKYDMISIDCEGLDFEILKQIDLKRTGTDMVVIEYNADKALAIQIMDYCARFGLRVIHKTYENLILARQ